MSSMSAEDWLSGVPHARRYTRDWTIVTFGDARYADKFFTYLFQHPYVGERVDTLTIKFRALHVHAHRIDDAKRYPNLKLPSPNEAT